MYLLRPTKKIFVSRRQYHTSCILSSYSIYSNWLW